SSLRNEWGERRADFALGDLFGAHALEKQAEDRIRRKWASDTQHTYLRLAGDSSSPKSHLIAAGRHPVLRGFEETNLISFGGLLEPLRLDASAQVLLTFVPPFPVYPPESVWMRQPRTT